MTAALERAGLRARRSGAFLMVLGLLIALFSAVAPNADAVDHPDHCGDAPASTQNTGVTDPGNGNSPSGNNGTVKIDGCELDQGIGPANDKNGNGDPDNEPHIGCLATVDWYNFDADAPNADRYSRVTFEVWPPSGGREPITVPVVDYRTPGNGHAAFAGTAPFTSDDPVYIGEDPASGANADGIDASVTYRMDQVLSQFEAHPQHGWHVKLTVESDGSRGADVKHKVFWTGPCENETTTTTSTSTTSTTIAVGGTSTSTTSPGETTTTTAAPATTTSTTETTAGPNVAGVEFENTTTTTGPAVSGEQLAQAPDTQVRTQVEGVQLARTGDDTRQMLFVAGLALLLGGAAIFASDRFASATK